MELTALAPAVKRAASAAATPAHTEADIVAYEAALARGEHPTALVAAPPAEGGVRDLPGYELPLDAMSAARVGARHVLVVSETPQAQDGAALIVQELRAAGHRATYAPVGRVHLDATT